MKKFASILLAGMVMFPTSAAFASTTKGNDDGGRGDCSSEGSCNDQRRCQGDNCRGSFSPGPFDRSPIDFHDNQICISPDCSGSSSDKKKK